MIPLKDDNPTELKPVVTITLLATCVLVFLWQISHDANNMNLIFRRMGVVPALLIGGERTPPDLGALAPSLTVFTSMFLHGGWMHLAGNMLYLWIFGNNVEDAMGHKRFLAFYLVCGVCAVFAQALPDPGSTIPMVGASGAISGLLGAYLLLYPHARVVVLVPIFYFIRVMYLPAWIVLALWFVFQLINSAATAGSGGGGVAFGAHIGGFIAGMALVAVFKRPGFKLLHPANVHRR